MPNVADNPPGSSADAAKLSRIVALNQYGRQSGYLSEGWASAHFARTFAAARALCADKVESQMGFVVSWHHGKDVICARLEGIAVEGVQFLRELPLTGKLADALMLDLQEVAMARAIVDLKLEEEAALKARATLRVESIVSQLAQEEKR